MLPLNVKQEIKDLYGEFAETPGAGETPASSDTTCNTLCRERYGHSQLASVPPTALRLACGCGNPVNFIDLPSGCTVVDLGCGGGIDIVLAARRVKKGRILGIDIAPEMIREAEEAIIESGLFQKIFFRVADIEDIYPLPKNFADVVLANCVINLCPDKITVYRNIFRILKPGGVLIISDTVLDDDIDPIIRDRLQADSTNCLSGAVSEEEHLRNLTKLTFDVLELDSSATTAADLETIARYPGRDSIAPITREDLVYLEGKAAIMTVLAQRRPLN